MNHLSIWLWHVMKSAFYMTTSDDQLSGWNAKKLQSSSPNQTCTKIRPWSLVVCYLSDLLQLSESRQNHYIWEVCSANRWDAPKTAMPVASIGQQKRPNSSPWHHPTACTTTNASQVEQNGLQSFASSAIFTRPLTNQHLNNSSILTTFCSENASTTGRRQKMFSKSLSNP